MAYINSNADPTDHDETLLYIEGVTSDINRMGFSFTIDIEEDPHLSDTVIVRIPASHVFKFAQVKKGASIRVGYDGVMMESYPVQITATTFEVIDQ